MKKIKLKDIFSFFVILLLAIFFGWFIGILYFFSFLFELFIFFTLIFGLYVLYKKIRGKERTGYYDFLRYISFRFSVVAILLSFIGIFFIYYQNNINPVSTPVYHISNGEKQVLFQTAMHVGSSKYYGDIKENIKEAKKNGYVLFYEGVKMDDKTSADKFNKIMGVKFDKDFYENFSKLYGLKHQVISDFLGIENNEDYNVDVKISNLIDIYEKRYGKITLSGNNKSNDIVDLGEIFSERLARLDNKKLVFVRSLNKAFINFVTKNDYIKDTIMSFFNMESLVDVILNERNKVIAKRISNSKHKKMFVFYGKLHFEGVFNLLKNKDSDWKIIDKKNLYPTK